MSTTESRSVGFWRHPVSATRLGLPILALGLAIVAFLSFDLVRISSAAADPADADAAPAMGGALVIGGGGKLPDEIRLTFLNLAGGPQKAKILIIPTADTTYEPAVAPLYLTEWQRLGAHAPTIFHTRSRDEANDSSYIKPIEEATGVWFGGGRQELLSQAYVGTEVERALKRLLDRGGVVGGSSAGAAILTKVMIASGRRDPVEGEGFDLLPNSIVDQHFLRRNRMGRMMNMLKKHPDMVGIGIDEKTALVVRGRRLSVVGDSYVVACTPATKDRPERIEFMKPGDTTDLDVLMGPAKVAIVPGIDFKNINNAETVLGPPTR